MTKADIRFLLPTPALRPYITAYYTVQVDAPKGAVIEDRTHPEWASLRFSLQGRYEAAPLEGAFAPSPEVLLFGPTSRSLRVRSVGPGLMQGVGLTGLGWSHLIDAPACEMADRWAAPTGAIGAVTAALFTAMAGRDDRGRADRLDEALGAFSASRPAPAPLLARLQALLLRPDIDSVEALAGELELSSRQVERVCREHFGFPPKRLLNRARFMRTLVAVRAHPGRPWRELIDEGYCDQSHFVRDFRRFIGVPATTYFASARAFLKPAADAREAALGGAYQALHPATATD